MLKKDLEVLNAKLNAELLHMRNVNVALAKMMHNAYDVLKQVHENQQQTVKITGECVKVYENLVKKLQDEAVKSDRNPE